MGEGRLPLDTLSGLPVDEAHRLLTAVKGIGPWTADIYLLFCLGCPDAFPVGDLALREAARLAYRLDARRTRARSRRWPSRGGRGAASPPEYCGPITGWRRRARARRAEGAGGRSSPSPRTHRESVQALRGPNSRRGMPVSTITCLRTIRIAERPNLIWLEVETDDGLVGLGESFRGAPAVEAVLDDRSHPGSWGRTPGGSKLSRASS